MTGTALALAPAGRIIGLDAWLAARRPACCPDARCSCDCGCQHHSHYRRCADCARGTHHAPRAIIVPLTARAAVAFGDWPPAEPVPDRLGHLRRFMRERPTEVE